MSISPRANSNIIVASSLASPLGLFVALGNFVINGYWWLTIAAGALCVLGIAAILWRSYSVLGPKVMDQIATEALINADPLYVPGATRKGPLIAYGIGVMLVGVAITVYTLIFGRTPVSVASFIPSLLIVLGFFVLRRGVRMRRGVHARVRETRHKHLE